MQTDIDTKKWNISSSQIVEGKRNIIESDLSIDDKIIALTSLKAEILISLKNKGHKFTSQ